MVRQSKKLDIRLKRAYLPSTSGRVAFANTFGCPDFHRSPRRKATRAGLVP